MTESTKLAAYLRLLRLHQRTGVWLLMWPCWWSVALASLGATPLGTLMLFLLGAAVMRPAGCIINDMADRKFDRDVARTRDRPLASGELSMTQGWLAFAGLVSIAVMIACALGPLVLLGGLAALPLVLLYPFMKRLTWWPQLFLGLTFNWGALLGWLAVRETIEWPAVMLYVAGIFWTLGYDTIYAQQDLEDDRRIGVKSSALRLGEQMRAGLLWFYALSIVFFLIAGVMAELGTLYYLGIFGLAAHFLWQITRLYPSDPASCLRVFRSNAVAGWIPFLAIIISKYM